MSAEYLRQMRELEKVEQEQRNLHSIKVQEQSDKYNTLDPQISYLDYHHIVNSSIDAAPHSGQTFGDYAIEAIIHAKMGQKINRNSHINGKGGYWHTHVDPRGCFMCDDNNLISVLVRVIGYMASKHPRDTFSPPPQ